MKTQRKATTAAKARKEAKERDPRLSPDGKWRSFPKVPHLLQYEPTAMYYARVKVCGKLVRRRLKTDVYSKALLRLSDFLNSSAVLPRAVSMPRSLLLTPG